MFEEMKAAGVEPTVISYSALISAYEKGKQWQRAIEVFKEMKTLTLALTGFHTAFSSGWSR